MLESGRLSKMIGSWPDRDRMYYEQHCAT